jgi:hypothetical protein
MNNGIHSGIRSGIVVVTRMNTDGIHSGIVVTRMNTDGIHSGIRSGIVVVVLLNIVDREYYIIIRTR